MKPSEAKVLVYLDQVDKPLRFSSQMALKLQVDNSNMCRTVKRMICQGWLRKCVSLIPIKKFYGLTAKGKRQLEAAKELLGGTYEKR